jgi:CRP-like cAMP-binding protein
MIGEMALMTETRRTATAVAREQAAVLRIPRNVFRRMLEAYPAVARTLQGMMEQRLAETMKGIGRVQRQIETIDKTPVRPEWA